MNLFLKALNGTRVYPLTDRHISGLSHEQQVVALSSSGARIIQLREKELEARDFYAEVAAAISLAADSSLKAAACRAAGRDRAWVMEAGAILE